MACTINEQDLTNITNSYLQSSEANKLNYLPIELACSFKSEQDIINALSIAVLIKWPALVVSILKNAENLGIDINKLKLAVKTAINDQEVKDVVSSKIVPTTSENISEDDLEEDIETHEELNPLLFDENGKLDEEVRDKLLIIVDEFCKMLNENNIDIEVVDVIMAGSNANYNYTKDSDIDVHILAKAAKVADNEQLYNAIYNAYRSLFGKKYSITIHGIPVELYVETESTKLTSSGIYSIKADEWIKEPAYTEIPEIDQKALDKLYSEWKTKCQDTLASEDVSSDDVEALVTDIYNLRQSGLDASGEFSLENLTFKEIRNNGFLDKLKEYKNEVKSKELSLEAFKPVESDYLEEDYISGDELIDWRIKLMQITGNTPTIDARGNFTFYNLKEAEARAITRRLEREDFIGKVFMLESGKFDFNTFNALRPNLPCKLYTVRGTIAR